MNPSDETIQKDVVVVGAGPAGLSAALAAARAGAQVTLIDNYRQPGGQYYRQLAAEFESAPPASHQPEGRALWQQVAAAGVELLSGATVWGAFEGHRLGLFGVGVPAFVQAKAIVLATGAYERVAAFPGWTLPGVMTTGAAQLLLKEQRILPGRRVLLAGAGPLQLVVAAALVEAGAEVVAVLEGSPLVRHALPRLLAMWGQWSRLTEGVSSLLRLQKAGVSFQTGWGVVAAHGQAELTGVTIAPLDGQWRPDAGKSHQLACDTLCCNYGFTPSTELLRLLGGRCEWQPSLGGFVPLRDETMQSTVPGLFVAGDGGGIGGAGLALVEGELAGTAAATLVTSSGAGWRQAAALTASLKRLQPALQRERRFQRFYGDLFTPGPGLDELAQPETIVCRCESVTRGQIAGVVQQGADTLGLVKSITRCGMGNCQGRVCGPAVAAAVAQEVGRPRADIGQFGVRPPVFPVPLPALIPDELAHPHSD